MITLNITQKEFNKIKFKKHHDQLRIIRHNHTDYDQVINDDNWKYVTVKFVNLIKTNFPHLKNSVIQWGEYKLTNYIR